MNTREILNAFDEWYGAEISPTLVSRVTNAVIEQVVEWQSRPLDAIYPIVYLVCIVVKARQDKRIINISIFLALGLNTEDHKELMGMWTSWVSKIEIFKQKKLQDIIKQPSLPTLGVGVYIGLLKSVNIKQIQYNI